MTWPTLAKSNGAIEALLKEKSGIRLDIGCGGNKQEGFVGMDYRKLPGVDIVWNILKFPWPLPDESVLTAISSHVIEHIPPFMPDPKLLGLIELLRDRGIIGDEDIVDYIGSPDPAPTFIRFMDEVWRVLKPDGQLALSLPHGYSNGFLQDPTHCNPLNEITWLYFDPLEQRSNGLLYNIYKPKPWRLKWINWSPEANIEIIMEKRTNATPDDNGRESLPD